MAKQNLSSGNTNTNNSKLLDAVALEQQTKYYKNGLDYITFQGQIYCNYRLDFRKKTARK